MKITQSVGYLAIALLAVLLGTAALGYPQAVFAGDDDDCDHDDCDDGGSAAAAAASGGSAAAAAASSD